MLEGLIGLQVRPDATVSERFMVPMSRLIPPIVIVPLDWPPTTTVGGRLAVIVKSE